MSGTTTPLLEKTIAQIADDGLRELELGGGMNPFARIEVAREKLDAGGAEQARQARMLLLPTVELFNSFPQICQVTGMIGEALIVEEQFGAARQWLERSYGANINSHFPMPRYKRLLADVYVRLREFEKGADIYRQLLDESESALQELRTAVEKG